MRNGNVTETGETEAHIMLVTYTGVELSLESETIGFYSRHLSCVLSCGLAQSSPLTLCSLVPIKDSDTDQILLCLFIY